MPLLLAVCTGNSCRSPMAEGLLKLKFGSRPGWRFASAGIAAWPGQGATLAAVQAARELGADLSAHRTQRVTPALMAGAGLVLAMSSEHVEWLQSHFPEHRAKIALLGELAGEPGNVEDPIGQEAGGYRRIAAKIQDWIEKSADEIMRRMEGHP